MSVYARKWTRKKNTIFNQFHNAIQIYICIVRQVWTMQIVYNWYQFQFNWKVFHASFYPIIHCCWRVFFILAYSFNVFLLLNNNHIWQVCVCVCENSGARKPIIIKRSTKRNGEYLCPFNAFHCHHLDNERTKRKKGKRK